MSKLEKIRDEFAKKYKSERFSYDWTRDCSGYESSIKTGFDASTAEWKRIVEPLVEALKKIRGIKVDGYYFEIEVVKEALEKYYEEIN